MQQKYLRIFLIFQGLIHEIKNLTVAGSLKNLQSCPIVTYYALYNNFFYTQLASFFVTQKGFFYVHDDTESFFLFCKTLLSFVGPFLLFVFFFSERFWYFLRASFSRESFTKKIIKMIFDNIICHFYIKKKIYKKDFISFSYML